jgi:predicted TIM-barrel fold metal-dependent hydrolase
MWIQRKGIVNAMVFSIGLILTVSAYLILIKQLCALQFIDISTKQKYADPLEKFFSSIGVTILPTNGLVQVGVVLTLVIFFKAGRNVIFFVLRQLSSLIKAIPGPKSKELFRRYLNIGRYAFHHTQEGTWNQLQGQYPPDSCFIVLPMDMEYMGAGKLAPDKEYRFQMQELKKIKDSNDGRFIFPFVFAEPRRIVEESQFTDGVIPGKGKVQLQFSVDNGNCTLKDCFIKEYIEEYQFAGIKIYPALGYYPFDEALLPLWIYAAENELPILTHCIRGNIFYRGSKISDWDKHPILKQADGESKYSDLALLEKKNSEFINNFTHPLNYLCLLEEELLRVYVGKCSTLTKEMFGYRGKDIPMTRNLRNLKICFGHFGGDDEWDKFMELDRDLYSRQLTQDPENGIPFFTDRKGQARPGKLEQLWKHCDWYSLICSMMLQFDNVYADLSYTIHNQEIHPLLKHTLQNPRLRMRTLFGTDFYVVRNHKSDKGLLASTINHLSEADFEQIAKINPRNYLSNKIHGPVAI